VSTVSRIGLLYDHLPLFMPSSRAPHVLHFGPETQATSSSPHAAATRSSHTPCFSSHSALRASFHARQIREVRAEHAVSIRRSPSSYRLSTRRAPFWSCISARKCECVFISSWNRHHSAPDTLLLVTPRALRSFRARQTASAFTPLNHTGDSG
jgi:hypothetical protein